LSGGLATFQRGNNGDYNQENNGRNGEKWLDSGYILSLAT
jgi:hypothetical protein